MKLTTALIASAFLASGMSVKAQAGRSFGNGTLPEFLKAFDTNNDGVLSAEEREAARKGRVDRAKAALDKWDTNGDGKLSPAEIEAARKQVRADIDAIRKARFDKADTDGNGFLSLEEFTLSLPPGMPAAEILKLYNFLNTDTTDAGISLAEFTAPCPKPPAPPPMPEPTPLRLMRFADVDTNHDGIISPEEFSAFITSLPAPRPPATAPTADEIAAMFAKLDTNSDNGITPDEWPVKDPNHPPVPPTIQPLPTFTVADKNADGSVDPREFADAVCASHIPVILVPLMFRTADADHDGLLSPTEYAAVVVPAPPTPPTTTTP